MRTVRLVSMLEQVKKLIQKGWCRDTFARNSRNQSVSTSSIYATKFCIAGAVVRVCENHSPKEKALIVNALRGNMPKKWLSLYDFNDSRNTSRPVVALINRTIKNALSAAKSAARKRKKKRKL